MGVISSLSADDALVFGPRQTQDNLMAGVRKILTRLIKPTTRYSIPYKPQLNLRYVAEHEIYNPLYIYIYSHISHISHII